MQRRSIVSDNSLWCQVSEDSWLIPEDETAILTSVFCSLFSVLCLLARAALVPVKMGAGIQP